MQMHILDIFNHGAARMTSQSEWHIQATIAGQDVSICYLDSGNNAEYDQHTDLKISAADERHIEAIETWFENEGESALVSLTKGSHVVLQPPARGPSR